MIRPTSRAPCLARPIRHLRHAETRVSTHLAPIPRTPYAAVMAAASVVGMGAGIAAASSAGGTSAVTAAVAGVLAVGIVLAAVPLLGPPLVRPETWGLVVLGVSGARTLLALAGMLVLIEVQDLDRRPVVYGVLAGTLVLMTAECAAAVWLLGRRERQRKQTVSTPDAALSGANGSRSAA